MSKAQGDRDPKSNPQEGDIVGGRLVRSIDLFLYSKEDRTAYVTYGTKHVSLGRIQIKSWQNWAKDQEVHHIATREETNSWRPCARSLHPLSEPCIELHGSR